jgi:hypothetical protein
VDGQPETTLDFEVPAGKRLVIETVTLEATVPSGQIVGARLGAFLNNRWIERALALRSQSLGGLESFVGTHPIRVRVDALGPGSLPEVGITLARRAADGEATVLATVDGYLVSR